MTGQPSFTFRERDENPSCVGCGEEMEFHGSRTGTFNEKDVYGCRECGTEFEDRWTF